VKGDKGKNLKGTTTKSVHKETKKEGKRKNLLTMKIGKKN
jgi:hypothetical protein